MWCIFCLLLRSVFDRAEFWCRVRLSLSTSGANLPKAFREPFAIRVEMSGLTWRRLAASRYRSRAENPLHLYSGMLSEYGREVGQRRRSPGEYRFPWQRDTPMPTARCPNGRSPHRTLPHGSRNRLRAVASVAAFGTGSCPTAKPHSQPASPEYSGRSGAFHPSRPADKTPCHWSPMRPSAWIRHCRCR